MIAILIPTLNRSDRLAGLVANIHETTRVEHRVYLIMETTDRASVRAAEALGTTDVIGTFGTCARAVNAGYWASDEPFAVVSNDDCVFHEGWDRVLGYFNDGTHIVGLEDGHGDTKSFAVVRREFIEEHSGVYDKPNRIFHEYKHHGPDTELAFYAMLRGVWADAWGCVMQHDRCDPDQLKARESISEDLAEYNRRWAEWDPQRLMPPAVPTVTPL